MTAGPGRVSANVGARPRSTSSSPNPREVGANTYAMSRFEKNPGPLPQRPLAPGWNGSPDSLSSMMSTAAPQKFSNSRQFGGFRPGKPSPSSVGSGSPGEPVMRSLSCQA